MRYHLIGLCVGVLAASALTAARDPQTSPASQPPPASRASSATQPVQERLDHAGTEEFQHRFGITGALDVIGVKINDMRPVDGPISYDVRCQLLARGTFIFHYHQTHPFNGGTEARDFMIGRPQTGHVLPTTVPEGGPTFEFVDNSASVLRVYWWFGEGRAGPAGWTLDSIEFVPEPRN